MVANPINQDLFMAIHSFCLSRLSSDQDNLYSRKTDYLGIPAMSTSALRCLAACLSPDPSWVKAWCPPFLLGIFHTWDL